MLQYKSSNIGHTDACDESYDTELMVWLDLNFFLSQVSEMLCVLGKTVWLLSFLFYFVLLTNRLHTAPILLCRSGVSLTCSGVTIAVPIRSQWDELKDPTPENNKDDVF